MISTGEILIAGSAIALAASFFGVFVVLRKMALTVDAMTHVALPGLALGLLFGFNPFLGGFVMLVLGVILIYWIEERTTLAAETIIGILFTAALAVGALIIPEEHLIEALFGDIAGLTAKDFWLLVAGSVLALAVAVKFFRPFARTALSHEFTRAEGVDTRKYYILYLLLLAFLVALGIKLVGALLMGVLVVLPAATSKNIAGSLTQMVFWSMGTGMAAALAGLWAAMRYGVPPGPAVVLVAVAFFSLSLVAARK